MTYVEFNITTVKLNHPAKYENIDFPIWGRGEYG